jgi:hypothetical protein
VFTLEPSVCRGGHYYATTTLRDTCYGIMHSFASGNICTNTQHTVEAFDLLSRMVSFYEMELIPWDTEPIDDKGDAAEEEDDDLMDDDDDDLRMFNTMLSEVGNTKSNTLNSVGQPAIPPPHYLHFRRHS